MTHSMFFFIYLILNFIKYFECVCIIYNEWIPESRFTKEKIVEFSQLKAHWTILWATKLEQLSKCLKFLNGWIYCVNYTTGAYFISSFV